MCTGGGLLSLCDDLRDKRLPELGVLLEDKEGRTVVKYVGREEAIKEREKQMQLSAEKQRLKEEQKRKQEELKVCTAPLAMTLYHTSLFAL